MKTPFDGYSRLYDLYMHSLRLYRPAEILKMLALEGHEHIIDLGGGTGYLANKLAKQAARVVLIDESAGMLERAARYGSFQIVHGDMFHSPFADESFDVAILSDVLHHTRDCDAVIKEANRLLKTNGILLIYDFDVRHMWTKLMQRFETFWFDELLFRDQACVTQLLGENLFSCVEAHSQSYWFIIKSIKRRGFDCQRACAPDSSQYEAA